jgi:hypothetical protein
MRRAVGLVFMALAVVLVFPAVGVRAAEEPSAEAIKSAKTAAEHNAIADAYAKEAAELRQKVADHKAMLASYDKGPGYIKSKTGFDQHCKSLISAYEKAAKDADVMAKMHRDMAAKAKP